MTSCPPCIHLRLPLHLLSVSGYLMTVLPQQMFFPFHYCWLWQHTEIYFKKGFSLKAFSLLANPIHVASWTEFCGQARQKFSKPTKMVLSWENWENGIPNKNTRNNQFLTWSYTTIDSLVLRNFMHSDKPSHFSNCSAGLHTSLKSGRYSSETTLAQFWLYP